MDLGQPDEKVVVVVASNLELRGPHIQLKEKLEKQKSRRTLPSAIAPKHFHLFHTAYRSVLHGWCGVVNSAYQLRICRTGIKGL